jgi:hypothetical protein
MDFNFVFSVWDVCWATHNNFIHPSQRRSQMRDTIDMAREAGYGEHLSMLHAVALNRFAELVRADERALAAPVQEPVAEYRGVTNDGHYIIKPMQPLKIGALFCATPPAAQPAQKKPQNCGTSYCSCVECVMEPAPVQEPVAWLYKGDAEFDGKEWRDNIRVTTSKQVADWQGKDIQPLYTTPPAQPAPVCIGWDTKADTPIIGYTTPPTSPVQEPVAWLVEFENGEQELHFDEQSVGEIHTPLYTTPPAQPAPVQELTNIQRHEQNVEKFLAARPTPVQEKNT